MPDLALVWDATVGGADLAVDVDADDLATDAGLRTAVLLSLFTDRRAADPDAGGAERRGWWADQFAPVDGDRIGSRLWTLQRAARRPGIEREAEEFDREALAWLVEDRVAKSIDVTVAATALGLEHRIDIYRPSGDPARFRFLHTWDAEAGRALEMIGV